jgi:hypothetical protein
MAEMDLMQTERKELRKLAQAATPGPWQPDDEAQICANNMVIAVAGEPVGGTQRRGDWGHLDADAAYIAACSPDRILALLDALDAAEKDAERSQWMPRANKSR